MGQSASTDAAAAQTLVRGLRVIEAVVQGRKTLAQLVEHVDLSRSTTHRLASALVAEGYLQVLRPGEYQVGPALLKLGFQAQQTIELVPIARPYIEELAALTQDTVHVAVLDQDTALYLDKIPGQRRVNLSSQVGERQPVTSTGIGKALILDHSPAYWRKRLAIDQRSSGRSRMDAALWMKRMQRYADQDCAYDLEENEDQIRCVAAPVRDARGLIVGAISVASAAQYMDDARMALLRIDVRRIAALISRKLGGSDG